MAYPFLPICIFTVCLKLLLVPMYHSTDMEVHRNWMAITHNKQIKEWYTEATSKWTLDYPPLFAWFEYCLSVFAKLFDSAMINIQEQSYVSYGSLLFMRLSVIVTDILYMVAVKRVCNSFWTWLPNSNDPWLRVEVVFTMLMLLNPGLLIIDHIHFQYNGFLLGFLLMSIAAMKQERYIESAMWYALLINFKHLYLCLAPAYFLYLLKNYCFVNNSGGCTSGRKFSPRRFLKLSIIVTIFTVMSFGPFIYMGQTNQVLKQMFPVKRGLTHAYWAPNFWALYNTADCVMAFIAEHLIGIGSFKSNLTKGLVQEYTHRILPSVDVSATILLSILAVMPYLWNVWKRPKNIYVFLECMIGCAFGSFVFGYHVHEKAVLTIILPFTILAVSSSERVGNFILLSTAGHLSFFPLLYQNGETSVKAVIFVLHEAYMVTAFLKLHGMKSCSLDPLLTMICIFAIPALYGLTTFGLKILGLSYRFPFLSLMVLSSSCSLCIIYCCMYFLWKSFRN